MKLTEKDKAFLETLKRLMDSKDLSVELRAGRPSYMVLRGTYGQKVHQAFRVSRQGVRWRFNHITEIYVSAYLTILTIESLFGTELRHHAMAIAKQRAELRQKVQKLGKFALPRRKASLRPASARQSTLTRDSPS